MAEAKDRPDDLGGPAPSSRSRPPDGSAGSGPGADPPRGAVSAARRVATLLLAAEALVLLVLGALSAVQTVVSRPTEVAGAVALSVLTLGMGAGLAIVARGVAAGARWSRAPALTWQLLQGSVAFPLVFPVGGSEFWYLGIPIAAAAVVVFALMLGGRVFPPIDDEEI